MKDVLKIIFPILLGAVFLFLGCIAFERGQYIIAYATLWCSIVLSTGMHSIIAILVISKKIDKLEEKIKTKAVNETETVHQPRVN